MTTQPETVEIEIEKIIIAADRQRTEDDEDKLAELVESIKNNGLINPIVIDREHKLIAGFRRIQAYKRLDQQKIRATYFESLEALDQKIIEFDENDKRKDLTWQERARAIKEIFDLQKAKAQATSPERWTASDTARSLGVSVGKVSEDLSLADALGNERVAGRPSRRGALDTLKRERELELVREIARRRAAGIGIPTGLVSTTFTSGVVYHADCRTVLAGMAEESVDLVIMDPPWGIDFNNAAQWTKKWIASYDDSANAVKAMLTELVPQLHRVLKVGGHIYSFFPIQEPQWWGELFMSAGFAIRQRPLIWFKSGQPGITDVYTSFLPCYESILWGYKPGPENTRRLFARPIPEAQGWPRQAGLWHENEKPVEMLDKWMEASSEINEVVLDPFGGGGSTAASAFGLGRYFITSEVDDLNYAKLCQRIKTLEERKEEQNNADV
jgi:ParB/RepB/Spo0J family partition protein